jgi:hypothetical protein
MSDPDRLTSHDDTASVLDTWGLVLRIVGCVSRRALLAGDHRCWNAVTVGGAAKRRQSIASDKTRSFSAAARCRSGFRKWATRVDHLIDCTIDDFATSTREIATKRIAEFALMSSV